MDEVARPRPRLAAADAEERNLPRWRAGKKRSAWHIFLTHDIFCASSKSGTKGAAGRRSITKERRKKIGECPATCLTMCHCCRGGTPRLFRTLRTTLSAQCNTAAKLHGWRGRGETWIKGAAEDKSRQIKYHAIFSPLCLSSLQDSSFIVSGPGDFDAVESGWMMMSQSNSLPLSLDFAVSFIRGFLSDR